MGIYKSCKQDHQGKITTEPTPLFFIANFPNQNCMVSKSGLTDLLKDMFFGATDRTFLRGGAKFDMATDRTEIKFDHLQVHAITHGL